MNVLQDLLTSLVGFVLWLLALVFIVPMLIVIEAAKIISEWFEFPIRFARGRAE